MKLRLLFVAALLLAAASCGRRAAKLPNYGTVPGFRMTDSDGRVFDGSALAGKVWVADFIYTSCPAECPLMSSRMRRIHQAVAKEPDVRIVSFSVDPARDTPAALKTFGSKYGGANDSWIFLTGSPETVHQLAYVTFHVGDVLGKIEHSTKFILVDKRGAIRGYYSSFDQDGIPQLIQDLEALRNDG